MSTTETCDRCGAGTDHPTMTDFGHSLCEGCAAVHCERCQRHILEAELCDLMEDGTCEDCQYVVLMRERGATGTDHEILYE